MKNDKLTVDTPIIEKKNEWYSLQCMYFKFPESDRIEVSKADW